MLDFEKKFEERGIEFQGCSDEIIDQVEQNLGVRLPNAYRAFLKAAGTKISGCFEFDGADYSVNYLEYINDAFFSEFPKCKRGEILSFYMWQGYSFLCFYLGSDENPPIFCFMATDEGDKIEKISESFTGYLDDALKKHDKLVKERLYEKNWPRERKD